jgi:NAD dependent epimerase/dehydratase family
MRPRRQRRRPPGGGGLRRHRPSRRRVGRAAVLKDPQRHILGLYNLYEAARANGKPRILFASSNHTVGFYRQDEYLDAAARLRPDGLYGVSKCFGEALACMYFDKFGQETALVRIGTCVERPANHRMLATWMSYDDFAALIGCVFRVPRLGCPVIWGVSDNASPILRPPISAGNRVTTRSASAPSWTPPPSAPPTIPSLPSIKAASSSPTPYSRTIE